MQSITFYDPSGRITWFMTAPEETLELNQKAGAFVPGLFSADKHYVKNGEATLRPECPATMNGQTITGIPPNGLVTVGEQTYTVLDGTAELQFDQPGTYKVLVSCWPYLDKEFTIAN
jgi:hypothetical protein